MSECTFLYMDFIVHGQRCINAGVYVKVYPRVGACVSASFCPSGHIGVALSHVPVMLTVHNQGRAAVSNSACTLHEHAENGFSTAMRVSD